jgi:formylglycine-generating enzyme required for sulfatase activity
MARRIFVELTALGEGTEDSARRVPKAEILKLPGEGVDKVLQILTDERLVTTGDADDPDAVTIAHEALIREWGALRGWVDQRREDIRFERELKHAGEAWRKAGRDRYQLLRGARLDAAVHWKRRNAGELRNEVEEFVEASWRQRTVRRAVGWGSILIAMVVLFWLALPTIRTLPLRARAFLATTRVNPKDGLKYLYIRPGEFRMGCVADCRADDQAHSVRITKGFWIGQTEVTQAAYKRVMKGADPSHFKGDNKPVETVNWNEADAYCRAVGMRLPTEAEWEYAARAGAAGERYGEIDRIAVSGTTGTATVGSKLPNAWGLYDMLGNVWEWTNDWYGAGYYKTLPAATDPQGPGDGPYKVLRGGAWNVNPQFVRLSDRDRLEPALRDNGIGFRCAGELR